jgi:hypothetical protein
VKVGNEVKALVLGLKLELLANRPEEVSYVQPA